MNAEKNLKELVHYIDALTAYYTNVLLEENKECNGEYINGKLHALRDIRKKLKKLGIE